MYFVYMLRCADNSIYTGITTNVEKRMSEHFSKNEKCAKYTLTHNAKKLETVWETEDRKNASKLEYNLKKRLTKLQKEKLINKNITLDELFKNFDVSKYKRII